jgi:hypothetical protein
MYVDQVQFILHASFSSDLKWILIYILVIFCPAIHLSMQTAYACMVRWALNNVLRKIAL